MKDHSSDDIFDQQIGYYYGVMCECGASPSILDRQVTETVLRRKIANLEAVIISQQKTLRATQQRLREVQHELEVERE